MGRIRGRGRRLGVVGGAIGVIAMTATAAMAGFVILPLPIEYETDSRPLMAVVGKLDGDSVKDMAVANRDGASVSILSGEGEGEFGEAETINLDGQAQGVAIAKVDGDNRADVVVTVNRTDPGPDAIQVLRGTAGGFAEPKIYNLPDGRAQDLALADLNKDGKLDAVSGQEDGSNVIVKYGTGNGKFSRSRSFAFPIPNSPTNSEPQWVEVGDFNRDGFKDIATAIGRRGQAGVLYAKTKRKDGKLRVVKGKFRKKAYDVLGLPYGLAVADLNKDGKLDLVLPNDYGGSTESVSVLFGKGKGKRAGFKPHEDFALGDEAFGGVAIGRFDEDNRPDIVASRNDGVLAYLYGTPAGFTDPYEYGLVAEAITLTAAKLNDDAESDVLVPQWNDGSVAVVLEEGDGE